MRKLFILLTWLICTGVANAQSGLFIAPNSTPITSPVNGQSWLFNSTNYSLGVWNGSSYRIVNTPFSNYTASVNPTSSNDNTQGYVLGSLWVNQTTKGVFMATNVATSAAVWTGINAVVTTIPLNDLQQGGATNGQSLIWNNGGSVWNPGNPAITLNQLSQGSATNGQVVTWSTGAGAWIPSNAGAGTVTSMSSGNLSPLFTTSVATSTSTPALSFALSNAASKSILSNLSGSSGAPSYNVLTLTAGTGLTGGGNIADSPTVSLTTPVAIANGGTGAATASAHTYFGNNTGSTATPGFSSIVLGDLPTTIVGSISNSATALSASISANTLTLGYSGTALPVANGGTGATSGTAAFNNLITGTATSGQVAEYNGTNWVPATVTGTGTVTSFTAGNLSPLFTTSVANSTTTPALTFSLSNAAAHSLLSNTGGSSGVPSYNALTITAGTGLNGGGNLTDSPTINLTVPVSNSDLGSTVVTSVGNLNPLFTTTLSSQTLGFVLSNAGSHAFLGNNTGSSAAPAYVTLSAGDLPSTTVNTTGNLSPLFTSSITGQALSFSLTNATGKGVLSNTSSSAASPAYNVLTVTAGTGLSGGGNVADSPTISLSVPVSPANGGTGTSLLTFGQATFASAGSVVISDSSITSSSIITVTQVGSTPLAAEYSVVVAAGSGFTIYSTNVASTATVNYIRIN